MASKALNLINYLLDHAEEDEDNDMLFAEYEYGDGWKLCLDLYSADDPAWETYSEEEQKLLDEAVAKIVVRHFL